MNSLPRITIVVPSFNQGNYIGETLESLVQQNYANLELIVIDGGSSDNSTDVIRTFEKHIKYWVSEKDKGQTHAINKGLEHATGDLFNWLNSDDVLEPGALIHLAELIKSNPNKNLFIGKTRFFNAAGTIRNSDSIIFSKAEITLGYGQVNQPAMFYKLNAIRKFLPLNEELHMCMDLDLWMKYLLEYGLERIHETDNCLAGFRFHDLSKTMSQKNPFREEKDQLYTKLFANKDTSNLIERCRPYYYLWRADELTLEGKHDESARCLDEVSFMRLSFTGKRRYIGVFRKLNFNKQRK